MKAPKDPLYVFPSVIFGVVCCFSSLGFVAEISGLFLKGQSQTKSGGLAVHMP